MDKTYEDNYDIVVLLGPGRFEQFSAGVRLIKKHLRHRYIKVITANDNRKDVEDLGLKFICEDELIAGMTFVNVRKYIEEITGECNRTGWYFQQFLKMAYAYTCEDDYYLIWDSDTIPGKDIEFLTSDGKMFFNMKNERHLPYFKTINILFDGKLSLMSRRVNPSFISEGMIINKMIMMSLIKAVEANSNIIGDSFWQKILFAMGKEGIKNGGFSEFETYGSYLRTYYPHLYVERPLKTERFGYTMFGRMLTENEIESSEYDTISFEEWDKRRRLKFMHRLQIEMRRFFQKRFNIVMYDFE